MFRLLNHYRKPVIFITLAIGTLVIGMTSAAYALPIVTLSSGEKSVSIEDNSNLDTDSTEGVVSWSGSVGDFGITITSGITKPAVGSANDPVLDMISFDSTYFGTSGGTLDIWFSETDFTSPVTALMSGIGGTTSGGTLSYWTYLDELNNQLGTGTTLASLGPYSGPTFSGDSTASVSLTNDPYSLSMHIQIYHGAANQNTSFDASLTSSIPDPLAVFLLGSACLIGFAGLRRKFKK